jgi:hypothetical protein
MSFDDARVAQPFEVAARDESAGRPTEKLNAECGSRRTFPAKHSRGLVNVKNWWMKCQFIGG